MHINSHINGSSISQLQEKYKTLIENRTNTELSCHFYHFESSGVDERLVKVVLVQNISYLKPTLALF